MNTYVKQLREQQPELISNALQFSLGLWLWFLSLLVIVSLSGMHPEWGESHHNPTTYLAQELNSTTSLKDQPKLKFQGLTFGI